MRACFDEILNRFPVRNKEEQKASFRAWALEKANLAGYEACVSEDDKHKNIVIGNPEKARVIFTAHYDTPWASVVPNLMLPVNRGLFLLYQMAIILPMLALAFLAMYLVMEFVPLDYDQALNRLLPLSAYFVVYYGLFAIFFRGRVNKNNANDNTSGIAAVFGVMKALSPHNKEKAAFILFDDEERGKKGSKAYAKTHKDINETKPVVNFDCVGFGTEFVVIEKEAFKGNALYEAFHKAYSKLAGGNVFSSKKAKANSDQMSFALGNAVMCCKRSKKGILYTGRIHTSKDTVVDTGNIQSVVSASQEFVDEI